MTNRDFDILNDLPKYTASVDFEANLMGQIEMPDESNIVRPFRWIAPFAMAASLACGVLIGNLFGDADALSGIGISQDSLTIATDIASAADPYNVTFADF